MLRQIGSYEILAELGEGGMSRIYRARDTRLGREVALKLLSENLVQQPESVDRFLREARAASALNHPNIVTIFEAGEVDGLQYIVMELVKGRTLRPLLLAESRPIEELQAVVIQIARALGAAHSAGIVHRDIKPENIMLRDDGYVKVVDFGIARLMPTEAAMSPEALGMTRTGIFLGTPRYMSPEQVAGEVVDSATDIFSLGVVMYEWVTGQHPFPAESAVRMMFAIMNSAPIAPSVLNPGVPLKIEALILEMLHKDAAMRPDANAVIQRLTDTAPMPGVTILPEPRRVGETPTVGRRAERVELRKVLDAVARGQGALVGVSGEPGIGKTALVEEVLGELAADAQPWFVARGRCSERLSGTEAYLPFLEVFDSLMRSGARDVVSRLMKTLAPSWYLQLSVVTPTTGGTAESMKAGSKDRLKRELLALLTELSAVRPLAMLFEDVHWADDSTVDLLAYVSSHFDRLKVAIIATYRPSELQLGGNEFLALRRDLQGHGIAREISVGFLGREDIEEYLRMVFPRGRFSERLSALVHAKTEGNPLFMADLVRDLRDRGVVARDGDGWVLAREVSEFEQELPASIRSMVQRKIDAVDKQDRELLVVASVQGVRFDTAIVARALDTDPADVEERLDLLERVHSFVRLVGEESLPDGTPSSQYRFVHALYQNELYASLRPVRRAALSGSVARALAAAHEKDTAPVAGELALLFDAARDFPNAARHFLAAASKAADVFADKEAIAVARRGLEAVRKVAQTAESAQLELGLQLALGRSLIRTRGYTDTEVEQAYSRARALCEHVGDPMRLCFVLHGLWQFYCVKGDLRRGTELAEQLLALATQTGDTQLLAIAHRTFGTPYLHRGRFADAIAHMSEAVTLDDPAQHRRVISLAGTDAATGAMAWAGLCLWLEGYPDQALERLEAAVAHSRRIAHAYSQALALATSAWLHQYRREPERVREHAAALHELASRHQFEYWLPFCAIMRGWSLAESHDTAEGIADLERGISGYVRPGAELNVPHFRSMLAEALMREERWGAAMDEVNAALAMAERNDDRCWQSELLRLKGVLALSMDHDADGERQLRAAVELARTQGARMLELRASVSLGRLWGHQGRATEAIAMLEPLVAWFSEGSDSADLASARALLTELAATAAGAPAPSDRR